MYDLSFGALSLLMNLFGAIFLRYEPRIRRRGRMVAITSGWRVLLMTLGLLHRTVLVDLDQNVLRIIDRRGWFFRKYRRIPFQRVAAIAYGYQDMAPFSSVSAEYRQWDLYTVGIRLRDHEQVLLFRFFGQGDFMNNSLLPDWMFTDEIVITELTRGGQETRSRLLVELLSHVMNVDIQNPDAPTNL